jgi:hypothetical protein
MSKGYGGLQRTLLNVLENVNTNTTGSYYEYDMNSLINITDKLQPSIHRALTRLVDDGLVLVSKDCREGFRGVPMDVPVSRKGSKVYILKNKVDVHMDKLRKEEDKRVRLNAEYINNKYKGEI